MQMFNSIADSLVQVVVWLDGKSKDASLKLLFTRTSPMEKDIVLSLESYVLPTAGRSETGHHPGSSINKYANHVLSH